MAELLSVQVGGDPFGSPGDGFEGAPPVVIFEFIETVCDGFTPSQTPNAPQQHG
jgi:hypothetical protein